MLIAEEYLGPIGRGITVPQLFRTADGLIYVVKLQNNCLGKKVLANEYLAAQLGTIMGLCFPPGDMIMLSDKILQQGKFRAAKFVPGPHFASLYLDKTAYAQRRTVCAAVNKQQMAGVILFDHMFHNIDRARNYRNLLVRREAEGFKIYAIDNSHLFLSGRWSADMVNKLAGEIYINHRRSYGILLKHFLSPQSFTPYVKAVREISDSKIETIINDIPAIWLNESARTVLLQFVKIRRDLVEKIAARLYALIPDKNRRTNGN